MNAIRTCLACALLAALAVPAHAAVREFGPEALRYTLDVPEGWQASEQAQGARLHLAVPGEETAVTISVGTHEGKAAAALVRRVARDLSGSAVRRVDNTTWRFDVVSENVRVRNQMRVYGAYYMVISMGGAEDRVDPLVGSLQLIFPQ